MKSPGYMYEMEIVTGRKENLVDESDDYGIQGIVSPPPRYGCLFLRHHLESFEHAEISAWHRSDILPLCLSPICEEYNRIFIFRCNYTCMEMSRVASVHRLVKITSHCRARLKNDIL